MKITFEGTAFHDVIQQMEYMLAAVRKASVAEPVMTAAAPFDEVRARVVRAVAAVPQIVDKPVDKPVEKRARTEKQLANDEKMRIAALERVAAKRAAKAQSQGYATTLRKDLDRDPIEKLAKPSAQQPVQAAPEVTPFAEPEIDPAEMVKIRTKTIEELQAAYANGHQKEVFELLSRFGNGAKSFRELPPEAFPQIRKAIDLGALE